MIVFSFVVLFSLLMLRTLGYPDTLEILAIDNCEYSVQQKIYNSQPQCLPRRTLVDLRQYFADNHDIIQVYRHQKNKKIPSNLLL